MPTSNDITYWNEEAKKDTNFSSVISPDDKIGLKAKYVNTINKNCLEPEILKLKSGSTILDFGCGVGRLSQWKAFNKHKYIGIDRSENMVKAAQGYFGSNKNLTFITYTGEKLPFDNNSLDCIIAIWVLQHILDDDHLQHLLNEFKRILKDNGNIFLIEQISHEEHAEYLKNGVVYKKHRTLARYKELFSENYSFVLSNKTDGLVSHGLFYKSLNVFSRLHFSFIKYGILFLIVLDGIYYHFIRRFFNPKWIDTFILFSKKELID